MRVTQYPETEHPHPYPTGEDLLDPVATPYRVWIPNQNIVVLGSSQDPEMELHTNAVVRDGISVYKRKCGGGAVVLSPGCVCVGLRMERRHGFGIPEYFNAANGFIRDTVRDEFGITLEPRGISDLAWKEWKVSGSSLYLPRECALYLASILVCAPIAIWDRWLKSPSRQPDYRDQRGHAEFTRNLSEIPGGPVSAKILAQALQIRCETGGAPIRF